MKNCSVIYDCFGRMLLAMIELIKNYFYRKEQKKALTAFSEEAKANLEAYYVMFQINRLRFFSLTAWDKVKDRDWHESVQEYIRRLTSYNKILQDYKDYEQWYNEDNNKNQENGRVLHAKKELAQEQFRGLEGVIKSALTVIEGKC